MVPMTYMGDEKFLVKRASVNHPIRTLQLSEALITEATTLSNCTEAPVIIANKILK